MSDEPDDSSPGWEAIDGALHPVYGGREPKHYGTIIKWVLGGRDPLDGISAYKRSDGACHWHFVSYGLTELYRKESENRERSGYGFELTFRLACSPEDEEPPLWAMGLMQNLARYVFQTGNCFAAGHSMTLNGPIAVELETNLGAVLFVADPELPPTDSAHGRVSFVQIVGITDDELQAVQAWNASSFTELLRGTSPLLVTDLARTSMLADPKTAQRISEGTERDGSSTGELFVTTVRWKRKGLIGKRTRLTIDALSASVFVQQLRGRLLHQRPLMLLGKGGKAENVVAIEPGEKPSVAVVGDIGALLVVLPSAMAREMSETLRPQRGVYKWESLKDFEIEVLPTEIKDNDGRLMRVVG